MTRHFAVNVLAERDFQAAFGECLNDYVIGEINRTPLLYRSLGQAERDRWLQTIIDVICRDKHAHAGQKRISAWDNGWAEHLEAICEPFDPAVLIPRYFGKYPVVRWRGDLIAPVSQGFEYRCFEILQHWLFDKYFRNAADVFEFGCGTGHNLLRVRKVNRTGWLLGLDWSRSSQAIMRRLDSLAFGGKSSGHHFDFTDPRAHYAMDPKDGVFTSAALEQVGDNFAPFIEFLIKQKPGICVHIEPINELLDETRLLDLLSIRYAKQRCYLNGFLTYMRRLEREGRIEMHMARRTGIGSLFLDGYSVIVWSPK